jgi:peptidoglycan/xylan/chitin deacetylase (PgdA/CDA1 family)
MTDGHGRYDYSSINDRPLGRWPGDKKVAVYVALGIEDYRFGEGHSEVILPGVDGPDIVNTSWRDYGNRVGAFRVFDRLEALGIPTTILLNTMIYDSAPDVIVAARKVGAEVVGHGTSSSDSLFGRSSSDEKAYLDEVAKRIEQEEGSRPGGWSSPWLTHTDDTIDLLAESGYEYLLDLRLDDQPIWLNTATKPLLAIPYGLEINDSTSIVGRQASAAEFADMIVDEFDELVDAAEQQPLVMSIVIHSFISGVPFRLRQLTRALQHLRAGKDQAWFTQPRHIHRAFLALSGEEKASDL